MQRFLQFIKHVFATFLGVALFFLCLLWGTAYIIRNAAEAREKEEIPVYAKQVLRVKLQGTIRDMGEHPQVEALLDPNKVYTNKLAYILEQAAKDDDIEAVYIEMQSFTAGLATLERLGKMIEKFRESGKLIICHSPVICSQFHLYLGAHADYHMVHPLATVSLEGFSIKKPYFKNTLDWIGIRANVFYGGDTKSGLDSFVRTSMKPEVKRKYLYLIMDMQDLIHSTISEKRHIDRALLDEVADLLHISTWDALDLRIIDGAGHISDVKRILQKHPYIPVNRRTTTHVNVDKENSEEIALESESAQKEPLINQSSQAEQGEDMLKEGDNELGDDQQSNDQYNEGRHNLETDHDSSLAPPIYFVSLDTYANRLAKRSKQRVKRKSTSSQRTVAYIHLEGEIIDGESSFGYIGSDDAIPMLYKAAESHDDLVIYINSPGGSSTASDSIRAAVADIASKKNKYVIVVMGDICASGGVMIALAANLILCYKGTITLSIGVYSGMFYARDFLANRCRTGVDGIKTNRPSDLAQGGLIHSALHDRDLSGSEKRQWQDNVDYEYLYFKGLASRNGRVSQENVEAMSGGFVCLGEEAAYYGLVDKVIDDLEDAIREVMLQRYQDEDYEIHYCTYSKSSLRYIMEYFGNFLTQSFVSSRLYKKYQRMIKSMSMKKGNRAYADLPFPHDSTEA